MSKYKFGDVYLVKFHPSYGNDLKRYRPAIIVSTITNNIDERFTTIIAVSTKVNKKNKFEVILNSSCFEKQSSALLWYIRTVDVVRLESKIGSLSENEKLEYKRVLERLFT